MTRDIYAEITDRIIAELEKGAAPWVKPWKSLGGSNQPHNAASKRAYSGINVLLLWMAQLDKGYKSQGWLTFKQAGELGGTVRKGEKSTQIVFVKPLCFKEKDSNGNVVKDEHGDDVERQVNMLRAYHVFNVEQCDGLRLPAMAPLPPPPTDPEFDAWVARTGAHVTHGGDRACYIPSMDQIAMPNRAAFSTPSHYSATMLHELGHWTGHKTRLDRSLRARFGDAEYAAEELIAELTAAYRCAAMGIDGDLRHAGYIGHWLKLLKSDKRAIFTAAAAAQKAAQFLADLADAMPEPAQIAA